MDKEIVIRDLLFIGADLYIDLSCDVIHVNNGTFVDV